MTAPALRAIEWYAHDGARDPHEPHPLRRRGLADDVLSSGRRREGGRSEGSGRSGGGSSGRMAETMKKLKEVVIDLEKVEEDKQNLQRENKRLALQMEEFLKK